MYGEVTYATRVITTNNPNHTTHPRGVLVYRNSEFGKARVRMYLPTTVELMLPEMKITGRAIPKAARATVELAMDRRAGESTSAPTKE